MYEIEIHKFIRQHHYWESLLTSAPYNLEIKRKNGLIMFNYSHRASDFSIRLVRECRGLILREGTWEVVCRAMDKFMNAEEENSDLDKIDWARATVQQKIDGSLIRMFYDWEYEVWRVSTSGTINAFDAELGVGGVSTFGDLFFEALENTMEKTLGKKNLTVFDLYKQLDKGSTYYFELTSPLNRVVVKYEDYKVYFLGWRDNFTGKEKFPGSSYCAHVLPRPKLYALNTYDEVRRAANALPHDEEGYVVCDSEFHRVKVKSPYYITAHYFRTTFAPTRARLVDAIVQGEASELLAYCPELKEQVEELSDSMYKLADWAQRIFNSLFESYRQLKPEFQTRRNWAFMVKTYPIKKYLFWAYDQKMYDNNADFFTWASSYLNPKKWLDLLGMC